MSRLNMAVGRKEEEDWTCPSHWPGRNDDRPVPSPAQPMPSLCLLPASWRIRSVYSNYYYCEHCGPMAPNYWTKKTEGRLSWWKVLVSKPCVLCIIEWRGNTLFIVTGQPIAFPYY